MRAPTLEPELLNAEHDPAKVAIYHERLERAFERKWRMLMDNRLRYRGDEQDEAEEPEKRKPESSNEMATPDRRPRLGYTRTFRTVPECS